MVFFQLNVTGLLFQSFRTASPVYCLTKNYTINKYCLKCKSTHNLEFFNFLDKIINNLFITLYLNKH